MVFALALALAATPLRIVGHDAPLPSVATSTLTVHEPLSGTERTFYGRAVVPLLDAALGERWRQSAVVIFHCADGYAARVEVAKLLKYRPVLAERALEDPFTAKSSDGKLIRLDPYYLVWDNLRHPELRASGAKGWPYRVRELEVASAEAHLEALALGPEASPAARRGKQAFVKHCVACHAISGAGGKVGPDLNAPVSVVDLFRPKWLRTWLLDPQSIRPGTAMPGIPSGAKDRPAIADDLIAYLRARRAASSEPTR